MNETLKRKIQQAIATLTRVGIKLQRSKSGLTADSFQPADLVELLLTQLELTVIVATTVDRLSNLQDLLKILKDTEI